LCYLQFTLYAVLKGNKPDFHQSMASEQSQAFYEQFLTALKSKYNPDLIKGIYIFCKSFYEAEYFIVIFMCTVQKHFVSYMEYTVIELKEE